MKQLTQEELEKLQSILQKYEEAVIKTAFSELGKSISMEIKIDKYFKEAA